MRGRITILIGGMALLLTAARLPAPTSSASEITICGDVVPADVAQANATFELFYRLSTDDTGSVVTVTKLKNEILPDALLVRCLQRWSLPARNAEVGVSLRWSHARGWTRIVISMPNYPPRRITIDPGWQ